MSIRDKREGIPPGYERTRSGAIVPKGPHVEVPAGWEADEHGQITKVKIGRSGDQGGLVNAADPDQIERTKKWEAEQKAIADKEAADKEAADEAARLKAQQTDMTQPGAGEAAFAEKGKGFLDTTEQEKAYKGAFKDTGLGKAGADIAKGLAEKGASGTSQGQAAYDQMVGSGATRDPEMVDAAWKNMQEMVPESLDQYYDLAFGRDQRRINQAAAARGRFGSTSTMRALQESANNLSAQQAKDEYTYDIERAKAMNSLATEGTRAKADWLTSMGDLAFNAADEAREYGVAGAEIARNAQLAQLDQDKAKMMAAMGIDQTKSNNLMSYMDAAFSSQEAREGRVLAEPKMMMEQMRLMAELYGATMGEDANAAAMQTDLYLAAKTDQERADAIAQYHMQQQLAFLDQFNTYMGKPSTGSSYTSGAKPTATPVNQSTASPTAKVPTTPPGT